MGDLLYRIELFLAIRAATPGPMCIWTGLGFVESIRWLLSVSFQPTSSLARPHWVIVLGLRRFDLRERHQTTVRVWALANR